VGSSDRALDQQAVDEPTVEQPVVPLVPGQPATPVAGNGVTSARARPDDAPAEDVEVDQADEIDRDDGAAPHGGGDGDATADRGSHDDGMAESSRARALRSLAGIRRSPVIPPPPPGLPETRREPETAVVPAAPVRRTVVDAERHLIAPVERSVGRRPRARKVTRVLRHVDPWSVFKVAAVFSVVIYGVVLTAGVLLWNVAYSTGTVDNIEQFFESFGWSDFEFEGGAIFHNAWIGGLFVAVAFTGFAVLGATLFNLITDLVGGVRMTVLEEEVVERTASPTRRFTVRRTAPQRPGDHGERGDLTAFAGSPAVEERRSDR